MIDRITLKESIERNDYKKDVQKEFNISLNELNSLLEEYDLVWKSKQDKRFDKLSKKYSKEFFIENYLNKDVTAGQFYRKYGLTVSDFELLRQRYGIEYKHFKFRFNKEKFYDLTDPNVYYFAGLIATDGHIDNVANRVGIALVGDSEKLLLDSIKNYFEITSPYLIRGDNYSYSFNISDYTIKEFYLNNFKIPEGNKTFSVGIPDYFYNEDCAKAYVRGCFDGDGCITHLNHRHPTVSLLTASKDLVYGLKLLIENYIPGIKIKFDDFKYFSINLSGKDAYRLLDWMYSQEGLRLERKYKKFLKVKDIVCSTE